MLKVIVTQFTPSVSTYTKILLGLKGWLEYLKYLKGLLAYFRYKKGLCQHI